MARVILQRRRARPLWTRNPWVHAASVGRVEGDPDDGDVVDVHDHREKFIARGFGQANGPTRVAALTWDPEEAVDEEFLLRRLVRAVALRRDLLGLPDDETTAFRLVHGAGDGLPGLAVDRFEDWLSVRIGSPGFDRRREALGAALLEATSAKGAWAVRESSRQRGGEAPGLLAGDPPPDRVDFRENGLRFRTDLRAGPKTGHFLDQRDNRRRVSRFARNRRVLDVFCSSGGFAIAAAALGGAASVRAVDESRDALALAEENARRNTATGIEWVRSDAFEELRALDEAGERFGVVILDPPAFARTAREKVGALRGYKELQRRALGILEPGGILVSCSCSSPVSDEDLEIVLREAAMDRDRDLRILMRRGQGPDHPVPVAAPESRYLTVLIATV